jgi:capsular polysaccharide transport system permease protein
MTSSSGIRNAPQIILAVLLRDMQTRFGSSYLSFLISIAWPLAHMLVILVGFLLVNRVAPVGDDPKVFVGSGLVPYVMCLYPARLMALAMEQNRPLLGYPIVQPIHIMTARAILEVLSAFFVLAIFVGILNIFDTDIYPVRLNAAASAIFLSVYLGVGLGMMNISLYSIFKTPALVVFVISMAGLYLTSGIIIPVWTLSPSLRAAIWYNPIYHCVGLLREAYYTTIPLSDVSMTYIFGMATVLICLSLLAERGIRGKFL